MKILFISLLAFYSLSEAAAQDLIPIRHENQWGFYSRKKQKTIDPKYDLTTPFRGGIALVQKDEKWGAVNNKLAVIIPLQYTSIKFIDQDVLIARQGNTYELLNAAGRHIRPNRFREVEPLQGNADLLVVQNADDRKFGIIDKNGKEFISIWSVTAPVHIAENYLLVSEDSPDGPLFGLLYKNGKPFLPFKYEAINQMYHENGQSYLICRTPGPQRETSLLDMNGKLLVSGNFDEINWWCGIQAQVYDKGKTGIKSGQSPVAWVDDVYRCSDGVMIGTVKGKPAFVTTDGTLKVLKDVDEVEFLKDGMGVVKKTITLAEGGTADRYGVIDKKGNVILPAVYRSIVSLNSQYGVIVDSLTNHIGLINLATQKQALPFSYESITLLNNGNLFVKKAGEKYVMLDSRLQPIAGVAYDDIKYPAQLDPVLKNDCILAGNKDVKGVINSNGQQIIPLEYTSISVLKDVANGEALHNALVVQQNNSPFQYGLISSDGKMLAPAKYAGLFYYHQGFIQVAKYVKKGREASAERGIIDTLGNEIMAPAWEQIFLNKHGFLIRHNGLCGFYNLKGQQIIPVECDDIYFFNDPFMVVTREGHRGIYTLEGKAITPIKYDAVLTDECAGGLFKVKSGNDIFFVDTTGHEYKEQTK